MRSISIVSFVLFVLLIILPILVGTYVYRDAKKRGMNYVLWTLIAIFVPSIIGLIIYLLVRGNYSNLKCPRCATAVKEQYIICPKCGTKLRPSCPNCSIPVEPDWIVCPKCAQPLPEIQNDIVTPVRPKDNTLWKVLIAVVLIPASMILIFALLFSVNSSSSSFCEVGLETYFADEELPQTTKKYVRDWVDNLPKEENQVYALRFRYQVLEDSKEKDYYYLIYIPGCGNVSSNSFGYSSGLFGIGSELQLELNGNGIGESFYCMMISEKKQAPGIRVILNGKRLEDVVTVVDFNPTLYTIATEDDYNILIDALYDVYTENMPDRIKAQSLSIIKYENRKEISSVKYDESDVLLTTAINIHELTAVDNPFNLPVQEDFSDYYEMSIDYVDATGETDYKYTAKYYIIQKNNDYYLIDSNYNSVYQIDKMEYERIEIFFQ